MVVAPVKFLNSVLNSVSDKLCIAQYFDLIFAQVPSIVFMFMVLSFGPTKLIK